MSEPTLMKLDKLPVADIVERDRLRPVSEAGVQSLIASIEELGVMKDAIHVRKRKDGTYQLIAGGHRLEAARRLGWPTVSVKVWTDVTDDWARMMEIDDNLAGAEMNALDTAVFLATRKEVYERIHPLSKRGVAGAVARWDATDTVSVASFTAATAEKFGLSERQIFRMIAAGSRLSPDEIDRLRHAPKAVSLSDLQTLAKANSDDERGHVVQQLHDGSAKNAAAARASFAAEKSGATPIVKDPVEEAFNALRKAWSRAPKRAKDRFADEYRDDLIVLLSRGPKLEVAAE